MAKSMIKLLIFIIAGFSILGLRPAAKRVNIKTSTNFYMTIVSPPLSDIPPYIGPVNKIKTPEEFASSFLSSNEVFRFARDNQNIYYIYSGKIIPRNDNFYDSFCWPDSCSLFATTKSGQYIKADYILGHTECLTGETSVNDFYYSGGKIYWIYPKTEIVGPFTNFAVISKGKLRCSIIVLLSKNQLGKNQVKHWIIKKD